jgi:hypothetical protein
MGDQYLAQSAEASHAINQCSPKATSYMTACRSRTPMSRYLAGQYHNAYISRRCNYTVGDESLPLPMVSKLTSKISDD